MIVGSIVGSLVRPASEVARSALAAAKPEQSFASVLGRIAEDAASSLRKAEVVSTQGLSGAANVQDVVAGVMDAERNLQTALALRDKLVSAYQEIIRMQI